MHRITLTDEEHAWLEKLVEAKFSEAEKGIGTLDGHAYLTDYGIGQSIKDKLVRLPELTGCSAVKEAYGITDSCCASCHHEMDEGYIPGFQYTLEDGRKIDLVCCGIEDLLKDVGVKVG